MLGIANGIGVPFGVNAGGGGGGFAFEASIRFDGSNDFINTGGGSSDCWNPYDNTNWTMSWWMKCETGATRFKNNGTVIVTNYASTSSNPQMVVQTVNATGGSKFTMRLPFLNGSIQSYKSFTSSYVITNANCQAWNHYAIVVTQNSGGSTQDIEIFFNGSSVDTGSVDYGNYAIAAPSMAIGSRNPTSSFQPWEGFLSEVALWEEALSSSEISNIYNSGSGANAAKFGIIKGYYRPLSTDGPQTGDITDSSGNKDLTMNGFVGVYGVVADTP